MSTKSRSITTALRTGTNPTHAPPSPTAGLGFTGNTRGAPPLHDPGPTCGRRPSPLPRQGSLGSAERDLAHPGHTESSWPREASYPVPVTPVDPRHQPDPCFRESNAQRDDRRSSGAPIEQPRESPRPPTGRRALPVEASSPARPAACPVRPAARPLASRPPPVTALPVQPAGGSCLPRPPPPWHGRGSAFPSGDPALFSILKAWRPSAIPW